MDKPKIYIDGQQGTTGLRIRDMLDPRQDIELLLIPEASRKDAAVRADFLNRADLAILCLPDDAAAEAIALIDQDRTRIIDTSTARRVDPDWVYGLPELSPEQKEAIRSAPRVANTGCYPVGFILAVRPLIEACLLDASTPLTVNAVSGYSGGGRKMIENYQQSNDIALRLYNLGAAHKHVAEMQYFSLTAQAPLFVPSVDHTFCGMLVSTPIPARYLPGADAVEQIYQTWNAYYQDAPFVSVGQPTDESELWPPGAFVDQASCNFTNRVDLCAFGNPEQGVVLVGRLDNLGKGASGNAVQCLNLMLGFDETAGLTI